MADDRTHDLHRFLTFVDACIAIAVTLLVLPLVDAAGEAEKSQHLGDFLHDHQDRFWAFLLSFAVISVIWLGHHSYLQHVAALDRGVAIGTLAWTFTIVLLPFPTALIGTYGSDRAMVAAYIGVLLVSSLCMTSLMVHVLRRPALWKEGSTAEDLSPLRGIATTLIYVVALLLGGLAPGVGYYSLVLLSQTSRVTALLRKVVRSRPRPAAGAS